MRPPLQRSSATTGRLGRARADRGLLRLATACLVAFVAVATPTQANAQGEIVTTLWPGARPSQPLFDQALDLVGTETSRAGGSD